MIYIENKCNDPHYNLAFEEYALKNICDEEPVLLLWSNRPSVIIGCFQNTAEEINSDYVAKNHIEVVRRITGGGAVYHDLGNLNYSFIIPNVDSGIDFKTFIKPLTQALAEFGIDAQLTGRNDVTVDGSKFSGTAQYYYKKRLLHHGTLLFDSELDNVASALKVKPGKIESKGIKSVRSRVTNLKPYFDEDISVEQFREKLLQHFDREYGLGSYVLSERQKQEILLLKSEKYDTWEWNYGRSPKSNMVKAAFLKCGYVEFHLFLQEGSIKEAGISGDFFGSRDIHELTEKMIGVRYDRECLSCALQTADIRAYLGDCTADELLDILF